MVHSIDTTYLNVTISAQRLQLCLNVLKHAQYAVHISGCGRKDDTCLGTGWIHKSMIPASQMHGSCS